MKLIDQLKKGLPENSNKYGLLCIALFLLLFRSDFTYNLNRYQIQESDTLWDILTNKVFHNPAITQISITYLKTYYKEVNWDHLEKNKNQYDGYVLDITQNKLSISKPNHTYLIRNVPILPYEALYNHFMQVLTQNTVIAALLFFLFVLLKEYDFNVRKINLIRVFAKPTIITILTPVILFLTLLTLLTINAIIQYFVSG